METETELNTDDPFSNDFGVARPSTESMEDVYGFKNRLLEAIEQGRVALDEENRISEDTDLRLVEQHRLTRLRQIRFEKRSRVCQSRIDSFIARRESQPPIWLQPFLTRIETQYTELKADLTGMKSDVRELKSDVRELKSDVRELKSDVRELKSDVRELKTTTTDMDIRLKRVLFSTAISENARRRNIRQQFGKVPFIVGEGPDDDTPIMQNVEMIDDISKEDCEYLLRGYGVSFSRNENVNLKIRLRDVLGFDHAPDLAYTFHSF